MPDLRVDSAAIRRAQTIFSDIQNRLDSAVSGFSTVTGSTVSHADLRACIDELGSSWGIGLRKLGEYAEGASVALTGIAESFEAVDDKLGASIRSASQKAPAETTT